MVTDSLKSASKYYCLGDTMMTVLKYLRMLICPALLQIALPG